MNRSRIHVRLPATAETHVKLSFMLEESTRNAHLLSALHANQLSMMTPLSFSDILTWRPARKTPRPQRCSSLSTNQPLWQQGKQAFTPEVPVFRLMAMFAWHFGAERMMTAPARLKAPRNCEAWRWQTVVARGRKPDKVTTEDVRAGQVGALLQVGLLRQHLDIVPKRRRSQPRC